MGDLLSRLDGEELMVATIVLGALIMVIVVVAVRIGAEVWLRLRERQLATSVILEMLDRQIPVDEIERVLKAAGFGDRGTGLSALLRSRLTRRPEAT